MRNRIAAVLGLLMTAFMLVILAASPAAAAETNYVTDANWNSDPKDCHASITGVSYAKVNGCFEPDGDILWLQDKSADGVGVALFWSELQTGRTGTCIHNLGAAKAWAVCNKDFTEGNTITWKIGWDTADGWHRVTQTIYSQA